MRAFNRICGVFSLALCTAGVPASAQEGAEVPLGLWQTEPDAIGVVLHVRTRSCGRALCARVERAKNRRGYDAPSNAVGHQMIWSMKPLADGAFFGEYRDTSAHRYLKSRVEVAGKELKLEACDDEGCTDTVWVRVK